MKALVLCGGLGTRLGELCRVRPKPLLEVGRLSLVEHTLLRLAAAGLHDVFVNLHFGADQLRARLGNGFRYGVRIHYFEEETLLGTAGTPRALAELCGDEGLLVHYGDVLSEHPLGELARRQRASGARARIVVHERVGSNSRVLLGPGDRVERFVERPSAGISDDSPTAWAFSGICVLSRACLAELPDTPGADLPRDVFPTLALAGELFAERHVGYRCAVDSAARLESARQAWSTGALSLPSHPEVT
jgi:NDP-sugar pyrophosphorylase family protein